jgi:hypothetical protein
MGLHPCRPVLEEIACRLKQPLLLSSLPLWHPKLLSLLLSGLPL